MNGRLVDVGAVRLHVVEAGSGPPVVLLHGFPEFWYAWRHQLPALADAGFRAIAVDLRGYNLSDKPRGIDAYRLSAVVDDIARLIGTLGQRAAVVGHDFGGVAAWKLAMTRPELVDRLAILNAPHPAAFARELRRPRQLLRSAYILFFQLPDLPEWLIGRHGFALVENMLRRDPVRPGAFTDDDIRRYKEALAQPGALTAALNYYRALPRYPLRDLRRIDAPTLLIWGKRDRYLDVRLTEGLDAWVPHLRVVRLPSASHWVQADAAAEVNRLLVEFMEVGGA